MKKQIYLHQITSSSLPVSSLKSTQQSVMLNLPPPINATFSSQKLSDAIIIDNVIEDIEGTPVKAPLHPLLKQLQVGAQGGWVQVIHY